MTMLPDSSEDVKDAKPRKQVYHKPEFRVYGSISTITKGFGNNMTKDGQGGMAMGFKSIA